MLNGLIMIGIIVFLAPSILFWIELMGAILVAAYRATRHSVFMLRVLLDVRKQPQNYEYLDRLHVLPFLMFLDWWSYFYYGTKNAEYVDTKAKPRTRYYNKGWRRPEICRNYQPASFE